ncbi:MAG: lipid-A-disaccharide synthase [Chthoniobacterales bacterium]
MPNPETPRSILFIAGEVSGDVHSAALARTVLARDPSRSLHALGGRRLREIVAESPGGEFLGDTTHCSAIGIPSAIKLCFRCRRLRDALRRFLQTHRVDAAVLCDWGGFNGRILPELHGREIPVLYYFPPRSWQRTGRPRLGIAPYVTRVATPFSWSAERLRAVGVRAEWVGHPSLENTRSNEERLRFRLKFGVKATEALVALLPGSRVSEIRVLATRMAKAAGMVKADRPVRFIAVVPQELAQEARGHIPPSIQIVTDCASDLLLAADAAIVKTGTASLEAVLAETPHVAVYDVSKVTRAEWCLLWAWRRIPFYAMPNIILEREAVPELIGLKCQPAKIAHALTRLLNDESTRGRILRDYALIRQALGSELPVPATERTAQILEEMLSEAERCATPVALAV